MNVPEFSHTIACAIEVCDNALKAVGTPRRKQSTSPFSVLLTDEGRALSDEHAGDSPWAAFIRERVVGGKAHLCGPDQRREIDDKKLANTLSGFSISGFIDVIYLRAIHRIERLN